MAGEGRRERRMALGDAAVLSLAQAAEALPLREADARTWLREQGLVRFLDGREVVIWADVLVCLRAPVVDEPTPAPRRVALRRARLVSR